MLKVSIILIMFAGLILQTYAQDEEKFIFENNPSALDVSSITVNDQRGHPLGIEVSKKLELLKDRYTYIEPAGATTPTDKTIVIKPIIFNSIQKLNRYYKSAIKKGSIPIDVAKEEFLRCLDIALIIYADNTEEFEQYLRKAKKPEQILEAYNKVILE